MTHMTHKDEIHMTHKDEVRHRPFIRDIGLWFGPASLSPHVYCADFFDPPLKVLCAVCVVGCCANSLTLPCVFFLLCLLRCVLIV